MKRAVFVLASGDPRISGRPAEAVRVAAGLSVHERLAVTLCLCGEAARVLSSDLEECHDGESMAGYLEVLRAAGGKVVVVGQDSSSGPSDVRGIAEIQIREEISKADRVLRF